MTAEQYPVGGEGRVTIIDSSAEDDMGEMDDTAPEEEMGPPAEEPTG